jgi:hypothetical protein
MSSEGVWDVGAYKVDFFIAVSGFLSMLVLSRRYTEVGGMVIINVPSCLSSVRPLSSKIHG